MDLTNNSIMELSTLGLTGTTLAGLAMVLTATAGSIAIAKHRGFVVSYLKTHIWFGSTKLDWSNRQLTRLEIEQYAYLKQLYIQRNLLVSLTDLRFSTRLQILDVSNNTITSLEGLSLCTSLQKLNCKGNMLTTLAGLENCLQLQVLDCSHNPITTLAGISTCAALSKLNVSDCELTSIEEISACTTLHSLDCGNNRLTSLEGIEPLILLTKLVCNSNRLSRIHQIVACHRLRTFNCVDNEITDLRPIIHLPDLAMIQHRGNPLDVQTAEVQQILDRLDRQHRPRRGCNMGRGWGNNYDGCQGGWGGDHGPYHRACGAGRILCPQPCRERRGTTVYTDRQNVHDTHVQKTVCGSVQALMLDPKPEFSIDLIKSSSLDSAVKRALITYCNDRTTHSVHHITYSQLLAYVWARIHKSEHTDELLKILSEQVRDSEGMCFTGRFNRLVSVLVGFYDDIVVEISDTSRIGAIILTVRDQVIPYDSKAHRQASNEQLLAAGYTEAEIEPWLGAITEL